jgi:alcohol dehydrogenase class IV
LARVVEWNGAVAGRQYDELHAGDMVERLRDLGQFAELPMSLSEAGVPESALPRLAEEAAAQWAGKFNPRHFDAGAALEIYQSAF